MIETPLVDPSVNETSSLPIENVSQPSISTSSLPKSLPLSKKTVEGIDIAFKVLSEVLDDVKKSSIDPIKSNVCEILSKHLGSDRAASQTALEKECNALRLENQKLQNVLLDRDNLRKKNDELRGMIFLSVSLICLFNGFILPIFNYP